MVRCRCALTSLKPPMWLSLLAETGAALGAVRAHRLALGRHVMLLCTTRGRKAPEEFQDAFRFRVSRSSIHQRENDRLIDELLLPFKVSLTLGFEKRRRGRRRCGKHGPERALRWINKKRAELRRLARSAAERVQLKRLGRPSNLLTSNSSAERRPSRRVS